eukprot:9658235-Alexandrium_andersonii.AAC.1
MASTGHEHFLPAQTAAESDASRRSAACSTNSCRSTGRFRLGGGNSRKCPRLVDAVGDLVE